METKYEKKYKSQDLFHSYRRRTELVQDSVPKIVVNQVSLSFSINSCWLKNRSWPSGVISPTCLRFSSPNTTKQYTC